MFWYQIKIQAEYTLSQGRRAHRLPLTNVLSLGEVVRRHRLGYKKRKRKGENMEGEILLYWVYVFNDGYEMRVRPKGLSGKEQFWLSQAHEGIKYVKPVYGRAGACA